MISASSVSAIVIVSEVATGWLVECGLGFMAVLSSPAPSHHMCIQYRQCLRGQTYLSKVAFITGIEETMSQFSVD